MSQSAPRLSPEELTALMPLRRQFPTLDSVLSEIARRSAQLTLPKGAVHVISDVHGDDVKMRHVINNASGLLRPLVEQVFAGRMDAAELQEFLTLIFYPRQTLDRLAPTLSQVSALRPFCRRVFRQLFELVRIRTTGISFRNCPTSRAASAARPTMTA